LCSRSSKFGFNGRRSISEQYPKSASTTSSILEQLKSLINVKNARVTGTILAFEVISHAEEGYFNEIKEQLYSAFIAQKIILRPLGNTVYILPPYVITNEQLQKVYKVIFEVLKKLNS
jgi:adenosylmethionine-8-amino-7-oxononanoate aminotransferase